MRLSRLRLGIEGDVVPLSGFDRGAFDQGRFLGGGFDRAILEKANLTNAIVSRSTTRGVDFDDWIKRGGKVVD